MVTENDAKKIINVQHGRDIITYFQQFSSEHYDNDIINGMVEQFNSLDGAVQTRITLHFVEMLGRLVRKCPNNRNEKNAVVYDIGELLNRY